MKVFVLSDWYLPGRQGGGAVTALVNLVELLGDEFKFHVVTRDRDLGSSERYPGIRLEEWVPVGKARVLYASAFSFAKLRRWISEVAPAVIYLNSLFSRLTIRTLILRRLGLLPSATVDMAPRGELGVAALAIKSIRKRAYLLAARSVRLFRGVVWQASTSLEEESIHRLFGGGIQVQIVRDVPDTLFLNSLQTGNGRHKVSGEAHFVFLSRISRNKNLDFALRVLASVGGRIAFDICGPVGDAGYWDECRNHLPSMPSSVSMSYRGSVSRENVPAVLKDGHFLLLPTGGENFGYSILEALAAGCPVVISDQTPWRDLEEHGAGWALPLGDVPRWREVLEQCVAMEAETYAAMSHRAQQYAHQWISSIPFEEEHRRLFLGGFQSRTSRTNPELILPNQ